MMISRLHAPLSKFPVYLANGVTVQKVGFNIVTVPVAWNSPNLQTSGFPLFTLKAGQLIFAYWGQVTGIIDGDALFQASGAYLYVGALGSDMFTGLYFSSTPVPVDVANAGLFNFPGRIAATSTPTFGVIVAAVDTIIKCKLVPQSGGNILQGTWNIEFLVASNI